MRKRIVLRLISLGMLVIAIIFVACALSNPTLGSVFYIGSIPIGVDVWRVFYAVYVLVMVALFVASFFVKKGKAEKES